MAKAPVKNVSKTKAFNELLTLKIQAKKIKKRIKELVDELTNNGAGLKFFENKEGSLTLTNRQNLSVLDVEKLFTELKKPAFLDCCTVSKAKLLKKVGEKGIKELETKKILSVEDPIYSYRLKEKK